MTIEDKKLEGYLTLKEASELFGYSPDYIGQLIRKGKIEGKQVYANVAWMTTRDALEEYLMREKGGTKNDDVPLRERLTRMFFSDHSIFFATWALRALIPILFVGIVIVFYFLSVSLDHKLARDAQERLDIRSTEVAAVGALSATDVTHITYEK